MYKGEGCSLCNYTGYRGRIPVHEILVVSKVHRQLISQKASVDEIRDLSRKTGMITLREECIKLMVNGLTTIVEVIRISYTEDSFI